MAQSNLKLPLVVILGATGSGKTKLSLDLAKRFGGEIIGADSMQIYKNMDIISAKATPDERRQAPHHLIDILHPQEICTVLDYRNKAIPIIDELFQKNKLPIIVGGTNYYIESVLWKILIEKPGVARKNEPWRFGNDHELPSAELHEKLKLLDPDMARRLHPNNKRKILRSLEVLEQKGRCLSDILREQQTEQGGNSLGGGLRYPNTLIFWLKWDQEILNERINGRVDSMVKDGLLAELLSFHTTFNQSRLSNDSSPDYTQGIFQMIGFKEFHEYLVLSEDERNSEDGLKTLEKGISDLKMVSRRYAKKQCKWIARRLLGCTDRDVPPVYGLTTDDLSKWEIDITTPAITIIDKYINNEECSYTPLPPIDIKCNPSSQDNSHFCETCKRVFVGEFQWNTHLKSHNHKRALRKANKKQKKE